MKNIMNINKISLHWRSRHGFLLLLIVAVFATCKDPDKLYKEYLVPNGGLVYSSKAVNPEAHPGNKRIEITWQNGANRTAVKARISWNNDTEGVDVDVPSNADFVRKEITPLDEYFYTFKIRTYDVDGNVSVPVEVMGKVYGTIYESSLSNRVLTRYSYSSGTLTLYWGSAEETEAGLDVSYTNTAGKNVTIQVKKTDENTVITDFDFAQPLFHTTWYLPENLAIDRFCAKTAKTVIIPPPILKLTPPDGLWEFSDANNLCKSTIGNDLVAHFINLNNTPGIPSEAGIRQVAGIGDGDYAVENDVRYQFLCNHGIPANNGGYVDGWTMMWDVKKPVKSAGQWCALLNNPYDNSTDATLYYSGDETLYSAVGESFSTRVLSIDTWYRIVYVHKPGEYYRVYINGSLWYNVNDPNKNQFKLDARGVWILGDNNGDNVPLHLSTAAIWGIPLSDDEVAEFLSKPGAEF